MLPNNVPDLRPLAPLMPSLLPRKLAEPPLDLATSPSLAPEAPSLALLMPSPRQPPFAEPPSDLAMSRRLALDRTLLAPRTFLAHSKPPALDLDSTLEMELILSSTTMSFRSKTSSDRTEPSMAELPRRTTSLSEHLSLEDIQSDITSTPPEPTNRSLTPSSPDKTSPSEEEPSTLTESTTRLERTSLSDQETSLDKPISSNEPPETAQEITDVSTRISTLFKLATETTRAPGPPKLATSTRTSNGADSIWTALIPPRPFNSII